MKKEIDTMDKDGSDQSPAVYDAYIIDEEDPPPPKPLDDPKPLSYRLGRAAGSAVTFAGFVNRIIQAFRSRRVDDELCRGSGKGGGRGMGRGKGRGQRYGRKRK